MSASRGSAAILVENLPVPFDRRVWQEARSLRAAGYRVAVISPRGERIDTEPYANLESVEIHRYPLRAAGAGLASYVSEYSVAFARTASLLRRLDARFKFDVVHACNPPDVLVHSALALRRRGVAIVFDHHDLVPELYLSRFGGRGIVYRATLAAERMTFRVADVVLSTNESYREIAVTRGRMRPEDVFVVRSAPDVDRFKAVPADRSLLDSRQHLLAYLGVMGPQDGVDHALRALAHLRRMRDDWRAMFIGAGDMLAEMQALMHELGLGDVVEFTGRIPDDDVIRILSTADVCLAPDPKNALNDVSTMNKVVEYMSLSRPIVSYDLRETRFSARESALYATPNDTADFARCIDRLLASPELRTQMGEAGRRRVETDLSWSRSEEALLAAYERALERARERR
jgi:glycosyltransferase involved in cell wall biosynthesis